MKLLHALYNITTNNFSTFNIKIKARIIIIIFFITSISNFSVAQQNKIDSLQNKLKELQDDTAKITVLNQLAISTYNTNPEKSNEYAKLAYKITNKHKYFNHLTSCYNTLAVSNWTLGNYDTSLDYLLMKIKIHEKENDYENIAGTYQNIAIILKEINKYDLALEYLSKSLDISLPNEYLLESADAYTLIGVVQGDKDNIKESEIAWEKAIKIYKEIGDTLRTAYIENNLGQLYAKTKQYEKALFSYNKALKICKKYNDNWCICKILDNKGNVYLEKRIYNQASEHYHEVLGIAKLNKMTKIQMNTYLSLFKLDTIQNNYKSALLNYTKYIKLKDSLFTQKSENNILEHQIQYETEKKENENEILRKSEKLKNKLILLISLAFIFLFILAFLLWKSLRNKNEINNLLNAKNKEITNKRNLIFEQNEELHVSEEKLQHNIQILKENKEHIEIAHKEITDSINYAKTIQQALLTRKEIIDTYLNKYFILFEPKTQVSGDFYYFNKINNKIIIAAADCTGHGVPGGFLTMLGITYLHEIVMQDKIASPASALSYLRQRFKRTFNFFGSNNNNGLNIALCVLDIEKKVLHYAGAYHPLIIIRDNKLIEYKATKSPIGFYPQEKAYKDNEIKLQQDDLIYLFSDGYYDQIGGKKSKKFMSRNFKNLLLNIHKLPIKEQKDKLLNVFNNWKDQEEQTDDVLIVGIKLDN